MIAWPYLLLWCRPIAVEELFDGVGKKIVVDGIRGYVPVTITDVNEARRQITVAVEAQYEHIYCGYSGVLDVRAEYPSSKFYQESRLCRAVRWIRWLLRVET